MDEEEKYKIINIIENENGHSIAEFMIIPKYRRLKIGKRSIFNE